MATTPKDPKFRTPDPEELQSETTRSEMRDRYRHEHEADLSSPDRIALGEATDSTLSEQGETAQLANRQMEITNRSAG